MHKGYLTGFVFMAIMTLAGLGMTTVNAQGTDTLSDDFKSPETPDPHSQVVDSQATCAGNSPSTAFAPK